MKNIVFTLLLVLAAVTATAQEDTFQGKTIAVIGDSYVRNHRRPMEETWHARVAERLGMNYRNYGRNGNSIAFDRTKQGFGKSMLERYKEMTDTADFVLVIAGHNDASMIGHSSDSLRLFRQRLDSLCTGLRQKYPKAAIGFVTPWAVERPGFAEVTQTIREVCAAHDFPVLDAARTSGILPMDTTFRKQYFQGINDTAHLNAKGHALLLDWGEQFLRTMARNHHQRLTATAANNVLDNGAKGDSPRQSLYQSFLTPPDSIRVGCYYYWINERVDPKGVKADLQWMKDNGITLAFLATDIRNSLQGDTTVQIYGKNKFQSKLWWKNLRTALKTAGELGIEMGIFNCPGWSQSGGPWVKPEEAMRNWTPSGVEVCKTKQGTDVVCSPCSPEATGLEVDKLSKVHVRKHFEAFFGEILRRIPQKDRPTLTTVVVDSWERGKQNYTDSIYVKFKQRFGYDLDYTAVADGQQPMAKNLNQLIADLVASEYMGGLTEKAHEYGLRTWCEPYAHSPFPANSITYGSAADEVAAEFWVDDRKFRQKEVDAAVGAARKSGKNRVWAESFTDGWPELATDDWSFAKLKPIADRYFHAGINASILHVVISQPGDDREPAVRPWFGTYFDRRSAHAADVKPLVEYLRRCNFMLQLGRPYNGATDQRIMDDGTIIRFTDDSQFEVTFPNGNKEKWNPCL